MKDCYNFVAFLLTENKHSVKIKSLISIPIILLPIIVLLFYDTPIWQAARDLTPPNYYFIPQLVTNWGLYLFYAVFAALFVYSFAKKKRELTQLCLAYLKAQLIVSFALVRILKIVLGRARPGHGRDFTLFSLNDRYNSMPSGHAADAFVSGVFLYYLLRQSKSTHYRFLPLIYALLIAVSRVFVSAHYPSDVTAGMFIGILGAWFFVCKLPKPDKPVGN
jgi:membrane-associated phospholipid phosphatase